jgi:uncharacterized LabA/DUF88 family protein
LKKIAIFVDVQNIYYTVKQGFNCHFNYSAFWHLVSSKGNIVNAYAYAIESKNIKQMQFQNTLANIGFEVKLKPYIQRRDGSAKGDWDVGITIDVMSIAPTVDTIILASGDGDFDLLLQKVNNDYNLTTEVYGVEQLTANSLIKAASKFNPIEKDLLIKLSP